MTTHVLKWIKYSINLLVIFGYGVELGSWYFTFNNISVTSWRSVLLVEETGVPGENHRLHLAMSTIRTLVVIDTDFPGSCLTNYHTITTTKTPFWYFPVRSLMIMTSPYDI